MIGALSFQGLLQCIYPIGTSLCVRVDQIAQWLSVWTGLSDASIKPTTMKSKIKIMHYRYYRYFRFVQLKGYVPLESVLYWTPSSIIQRWLFILLWQRMDKNRKCFLQVCGTYCSWALQLGRFSWMWKCILCAHTLTRPHAHMGMCSSIISVHAIVQQPQTSSPQMAAAALRLGLQSYLNNSQMQPRAVCKLDVGQMVGPCIFRFHWVSIIDWASFCMTRILVDCKFFYIFVMLYCTLPVSLRQWGTVLYIKKRDMGKWH